MPRLTAKKKAYAEARIAGKNITQSAIAAGCPAKTAPQAGSRYEKDREILAYIARMGCVIPGPTPSAPMAQTVKAATPSPVLVTPAPSPEPAPQPIHAPAPPSAASPTPAPAPAPAPVAPLAPHDPDEPEALTYLRSVMNDPGEEPRLRLDAAKALASYTVAKPGEKGKKEARQEEAERIGSKFAPSAPPRLAAVGGRKA